jgi:hypothetical protein
VPLGGLFGGIPVVENRHIQPVPVLQLSPNFKWCSEEFRAETNAWLLDLFGTKEVAYLVHGFGLVMHPKHVAMLKGLKP